MRLTENKVTERDETLLDNIICEVIGRMQVPEDTGLYFHNDVDGSSEILVMALNDVKKAKANKRYGPMVSLIAAALGSLISCQRDEC